MLRLFYQLGNLTLRNDVGNALAEQYTYDELNRLTTITLPNESNQVENSFTYDVLGNMLTKADVGTYTYPPAGQARPHGVASITNGGNTTSFTYDQGVSGGNGNVSSESGAVNRTVAWSIFKWR